MIRFYRQNEELMKQLFSFGGNLMATLSFYEKKYYQNNDRYPLHWDNMLACIDIAGIYFLAGDNNKALDYYEEAESIYAMLVKLQSELRIAGNPFSKMIFYERLRSLEYRIYDSNKKMDKDELYTQIIQQYHFTSPYSPKNWLYYKEHFEDIPKYDTDTVLVRLHHGKASVCRSLADYKKSLLFCLDCGWDDFQYNRVDYRDALAEYTKELKIVKAMSGYNESFQTAEVHLLLGYTNTANGYYNIAKENFEDILNIMHNSANEITAKAHKGLGDCYKLLIGGQESAINEYNKALREYEFCQMEGSVEYVDVLFSLGDVYVYLEEYSSAKNVYNQIIEGCKKALYEKPLTSVYVYLKLADLYEISGQYKQADIYCDQAMHLCKQFVGELHLETANIYIRKAVLLLHSESSNCKEIIANLTHALDIYKVVVGAHEQSTSYLYLFIGDVYYYTQNITKAADFYALGSSFLRFSFSFRSPDFYRRTGNVCLAIGKYDEAIAEYEKALSTISYTDKDFFIHLVQAYEKNGNLEKAEFYKRYSYK